jgi:hypothetical protein
MHSTLFVAFLYPDAFTTGRCHMCHNIIVSLQENRHVNLQETNKDKEESNENNNNYKNMGKEQIRRRKTENFSHCSVEY